MPTQFNAQQISTATIGPTGGENSLVTAAQVRQAITTMGGGGGLFEFDSYGDIQYSLSTGSNPFELDSNGDIQPQV